MNSSKINIDEVIYKLLQGLRRKGYSIGTDAYIKTTEVFYWFLKERKGNSMAEFAPYLAPVICKSVEEQTDFKLIFQELFANEFTAFEKNFFSEIQKKEEREKKRIRHRFKNILLIIFGLSILAVLFEISKNGSAFPIPDYNKLVTQPLYVNRNDTVAFCGNDVFKNMRDSNKFNVEYNIHKSKTKHNGFQAKHSFDKFGRDTITAKLKSKKPGIDSTIEFLKIFIGPEKLYINAEKDKIDAGDENIFTANIESTIKTDFYWEIIKENILTDNVKDSIRLKGNPVTYTFKEEGNYVINVKYDVSKNDFLKDFPADKLSGSYYQKVTTAGLQLNADYTAAPPIVKASVNKWWLFGLLFLSLLLLYVAIKLLRKNVEKLSQKKSIDIFTGNKPPFDLSFSNRNKNISYTYDLLRLSNHLKKRIDSPDFFLDISKTIKQSILNRGFPTPGFSQKQQTRQCLFLIDQAYKNSQQVKLFSYLAMYLIKNQVKLDFYFYYQTPEKFYTDEDGPRFTLQTLKDRYYNCALIFFTDGTNFPEYNAPGLKEAITIGFAYWQHRLLVTPVNYNDWGRNERLLSTFFNVIPADVVGLLELIRALDTESSTTKMLQGQFNSYESKHVDFSTVRGLEEYLHDDDIFQWVCALAIHPKIYWEVILEIGKAIVVNPAKVNYETLLKLARIQWIHEGNFPTYTRLELLKVLTKENEIKAREVFLKMLDEIPLGDEQFSYEEKQMSRYANSFVLFATGILKYTTDKNIQDDEEKFISLYKNESIADNAFKIYIEKKETAEGDWNTPISSENENIGIEKYIDAKEKDELNAIRNERLKRNNKLARYIGGSVALLLLLGYIFFNKDAIAKSRVNKYLKITDTTLLTKKSIFVSVDTTECLKKLLLLSKDSVATLEIIKGSSLVAKKIIKYGDSLILPVTLKNFLNDNENKNITYRLIVNEQVFRKQMPMLTGNYFISLTGCEKERLNITYNVGYNEDTTAVFSAFREERNLINKIPATNNNIPKANRVTFDSIIGKNEIFNYADKLIKAGFPLKNVSIRNRQTAQKNISIDGKDSLNIMPNFTSATLEALLFPDSTDQESKINKPTIKIFFGADVGIGKITEMKSCLKNNFNVNIIKRVGERSIVNQLYYFDKKFKDSVKYLLNCLKTYFPGKTFKVSKPVATKDNTAAAEIYLLDESRFMQFVSVSVSDDILLPQANKFKNNLMTAGYNVPPLTSKENIKESIIEYHLPDQQFSANEIKKIYSNYFRTSQIRIEYNPDSKNRYINVWIKKLNDPSIEKFFLRDVKFPSKIKMKNKFPIAFTIGFENLKNPSPLIIYNGKICLSENGNKNNKALYICENFNFSKGNKKFITTEVDATTNSSGRYSVRVIIDQLKMDTILGMVQIENVAGNDVKQLCDTIYSYVGPSDDYTVFKGQTYDKSNLKRKGIELTLITKDPKSISLNITAGKCPAMKISFYPGETKTVTLCDDTKITLRSVNAEKTSTNRQNNWALFDVILCDAVLNPALKNARKSNMKSK